MAIVVNPSLLREIKRHGAFDISACFHCGNCTAVCPLSDQHGNFPRKMIRLGQLGDRTRLLGGPEAWLCYYCGECSDTCPRQAEPGEYMAALRRMSIADAEPTGLARLVYRSGFAMLVVTLLVAAILGTFLVSVRTPGEAPRWLFDLVSYETIHNLGVGVGAIATLTIVMGVVRVMRRFLGGVGPRSRPSVIAAARRTVREIATMKRHRAEAAAPGPWYANAAWVHLAIMYGFAGLLAATVLDLVFIVMLPLHITTFWPARILGTVSGLAMIAGVSAAIYRRAARIERSVKWTGKADAWLLAVLLVLGITGFWLEVAVTLHAGGPVQNAVLLVHAAIAMELVLLMAFTKMAHVLYRPIALFAYYLRLDEPRA